MDFPRTRVALSLAAIIALTSVSVANAQTVSINKCAAAKTKCVSGLTKSLLGCHQKAENKGVAVDPSCYVKPLAKFGFCIVKPEAKPPCLTTGDGATLQAAIEAYVLDVVTQLDPGYPAPVLNKCAAGKTKAVAARTASHLGCLAKAFGKTGAVDPTCLGKAEVKFSAAWAKLELKPPCLTTADEVTLAAMADAFFAAHAAGLNGGGGGSCGNGLNDVGEACDASAPSSGWGQCGADFTCTACNCACPTRYEFAVDAADPATVLDLGWTGLGHRQPLVSNGTITLGLSCGASSRPCGSCSITGPVANGAGQLANRRCTNDTAIPCTDDSPCTGGGGICRYFLTPPQGLGVGGTTLCVTNELVSGPGGAVNVESGESNLVANARMEIYLAAVSDSPCPRCLGDATPNDGAKGGTCNGGLHNTVACDGNGAVPGFPDFGMASLDCPPSGTPLWSHLIDLTSATDPVTRTVTASSPSCTAPGFTGEKCLCSTCNHVSAKPCFTDAECPDPPGPTGPICGGRRCLGGTNGGTPCVVNSECPSSVCNLLGASTKPSECVDDTTTPGVHDCADTAPVDGEGACTIGPVDSSCSIASGHPQRGCLNDAACGGGAGTCQTSFRKCFLTGSATGFGNVGTQTLIANGLEDTPVRDVAHPTLGSVACVAPGTSSFVYNTFGFPGPMRLTRKGTATAHP